MVYRIMRRVHKQVLWAAILFTITFIITGASINAMADGNLQFYYNDTGIMTDTIIQYGGTTGTANILAPLSVTGNYVYDVYSIQASEISGMNPSLTARINASQINVGGDIGSSLYGGELANNNILTLTMLLNNTGKYVILEYNINTGTYVASEPINAPPNHLISKQAFDGNIYTLITYIDADNNNRFYIVKYDTTAGNIDELINTTIPNNQFDIYDFTLDANGNIYIITATTIYNYTIGSTVPANYFVGPDTDGNSNMMLRVFTANNAVYILWGPKYDGPSLALYKITDIAAPTYQTIQIQNTSPDILFYNYLGGDYEEGVVKLVQGTNEYYVIMDAINSGYTDYDTAKKSIAIAKIDLTTDTFEFLRYANLTEIINGGGAAFTDFPNHLSMDIGDDGNYYLAFVVMGTGDSTVYALYVSPPAGNAPPSGGSPPAAGSELVKLSIVANYGGDNESYRFIGYVIENKTSYLEGWLVAETAQVELVNGKPQVMPDSYGVSIFNTLYNDTDGFRIGQVLETYNLSRPTFVFNMIINQSLVIGGGNNTWNSGMIQVYNITEKTLTTQLYNNLKPFLTYGMTAMPVPGGQTVIAPFIVVSNGSIYYVGASQLPPAETDFIPYTNDALPIGSWSITDGNKVAIASTAPLGNYSYIAVLVNTTDPTGENGAKLLLYKFNATGLTITNTTGIFFPGLNNTIAGLGGVYVTTNADSNNNPYDMVIMTFNDYSKMNAYMILYNGSSNRMDLVMNLTGTVLYYPQMTTLGLIVAGGLLNQTNNLFQATLFMIDTVNNTLVTIGGFQLPASNSEIIYAQQLNNSYIVSLARSYASPDNLTVAGGTTTQAAPVPEPWLLPIAFALSMIAIVIVAYKKK